MAAYSVTDYVTELGTLEEVMALLETKLETYDSTTNTIRLLKVMNVGADFKGILIIDA